MLALLINGKEEILVQVIWVNKVIFGKLIQSSIFFGEESDSSLIEWRFKKTDVGANVNWSFTSQGKYPFGRLMLKMMAGEMQSSLEQGLANLKEIIEANPPKLYTTGDFTVEVLPEMHVLMIPASGTMEEITSQFDRIFTALFTYTGANNIQVAGPPFAYYIDFDEETGFSNAMIGVHLAEPAKSTGEMIARTFKETKAVTTVHSGKYEYLKDSYGNLTEYAEETGLELTGGAFEIYKKTMMESPNPIDWKTVIAYPIK